MLANFTNLHALTLHLFCLKGEFPFTLSWLVCFQTKKKKKNSNLPAKISFQLPFDHTIHFYWIFVGFFGPSTAVRHFSSQSSNYIHTKMNASARTRLTTSLFSTTFFIAILTVAAPQIIGCPATKSTHFDNDAKKKKLDNSWDSKPVIVTERSN